MKIRSFGWRDIPLLHNYRNRGLFLDSARVLTHGPGLVPVGAFLTFLGPATRILTYRCEGDSQPGLPLIGQVTYVLGASNARFSFLAPANGVESADLSALSDFLAMEMGKRGVFHILAEVDESSQVYPMLRRAGFAIYARQRIYRTRGQAEPESMPVTWRSCKPRDVIGASSLYCNIVPGLVQQVEPLSKRNMKGLVYYQDGEIRAYVELKYGRSGIWAQPFVHPDAQGFEQHLAQMLLNLPGRRDRPLFVCIRSYQSWLESALEEMGAEPGPHQAVMVRHLTVTRRVKQTYPLPSINGTRAEPTAPIARIDESAILEPAEAGKHPGSGSAV